MFFHTYLTDLIKNRDVAAALERIQNNKEINSCTYWEQYTPLHLAIETNQPSIVDALLAANANVNAVTYHDTLTPLHIAASSADIRSIQALVKYNPNLNSKTYKDQDTALHLAVKHGFLAHAEVLLKAGVMVDLLNKNSETALHLAAKQGNMQMLALLLSYGANCNIHNHNEQTPLFVALMAEHSECVDLLARNGAIFGRSFNSVKKLQTSYEQECKKNNALYQENAMLRSELAYAKNTNADLTKKIEKLQQMLSNIPVAEAVGGRGPTPR
jgi:ankyrin repeat protein